MSTRPANDNSEEKRKIWQLVAIYVGLVVALGLTIWFELPHIIESGLLAIALTLSLYIAIRVGRSVARKYASIPFALRPSLTARSAGVLVFVALAPLAIACAKLIYPRSWPTTIEEALAILDRQVDPATKKELAYAGFDDLTELPHAWKHTIRNDFGLWERNGRLLARCDPDYKNPDSCASVITSRFWRRARAELPPAELAGLEALEKNMERVRLRSERFEQRPLREVVAYFNDAIRSQLAAPDRFEIRIEPAHADRPISAAWHALDNISLREALSIVLDSNKLKARKAPPDLYIEPT